jgi:hypothetical protein
MHVCSAFGNANTESCKDLHGRVIEGECSGRARFRAAHNFVAAIGRVSRLSRYGRARVQQVL